MDGRVKYHQQGVDRRGAGKEMALEHQNDEQRLLTTEEAQELINLYARREQARIAEAERLAAMPKLSDVAHLIGVPVEELVPLLVRLRGVPPTRIEGESEFDVRLSQFEADRLIELYGQSERRRQIELERRAQMVSVSEVAEGLNISSEDAEDLLKAVRRAKEPMPPVAPEEIPETLSDRLRREGFGVRVPPPGENSENARLRLSSKPSRQNLTGVVGACAVTAIAFYILGTAFWNGLTAISRTAGMSYPTNTAPAAYSPPPASGGILFHPATPYGAGPAVGSHYGYYSVPQGYSVKLFGGTGFAEQNGLSGEVLDPERARVRLRDTFGSLCNAIPANTTVLWLPIESSQVPYGPPMAPRACSDIAGWSILEIGDGKTTRRVYVPNNFASNPPTGSGKVDIERRLDYVFGLSEGVAAANQAVRFESIPGLTKSPPAGVAVTVFAFGHAYRSVGAGKVGPAVDAALSAKAIENSIAETVRYAYSANKGLEIITASGGQEFVLTRDAKGVANLVPFRVAVNVSYPGGARCFSVVGYREALASGDKDGLAAALDPGKAIAVTAGSALCTASLNASAGGRP